MKSTRRQTQQEIAQFKSDTIALKKAIGNLVSKPPVPGLDLKVPSFLKSHLLFNFEIQQFLELWETLGGFDEQSIESTHPDFNELLRQFGSTRGARLKIQVMRQFLFNEQGSSRI